MIRLSLLLAIAIFIIFKFDNLVDQEGKKVADAHEEIEKLQKKTQGSNWLYAITKMRDTPIISWWAFTILETYDEAIEWLLHQMNCEFGIGFFTDIEDLKYRIAMGETDFEKVLSDWRNVNKVNISSKQEWHLEIYFHTSYWLNYFWYEIKPIKMYTNYNIKCK